jgi:hypothetical protein
VLAAVLPSAIDTVTSETMLRLVALVDAELRKPRASAGIPQEYRILMRFPLTSILHSASGPFRGMYVTVN